MRLRFTSPLVLLAAAALLGGCGGGESAKTASSAASAANGGSTVASGAPTSSATTSKSGAQPHAQASTTTAPAGGAANPPASSSTPSPTKAPRVSGMPGTTITHFGVAASASDREAVTTLVKRYYAALAADRGGAACALLGARIRHPIERSLGHTPLAHGNGCEGVVTIIFHHHPGQKSSVSPSVAVTGVRVSGDRGYALISTAQRPSEEIRIEREHGAWRLGALIGSPLAP